MESTVVQGRKFSLDWAALAENLMAKVGLAGVEKLGNIFSCKMYSVGVFPAKAML